MLRDARKHFQFFSIFCLLLAASCTQIPQDPNVFEQTVTLIKSELGEPNYLYIPFEVPANTRSLSISYEYDSNKGKNRVELGVFDNRFSGDGKDKNGFRGWSGSVRDTVFVAEESATHGYIPGNITRGKWYAVLGLAKIEKSGVEVNLKVRFNEIDEEARQQFDEENRREFSFKKKDKVERLKTGDLTWFAGDLHAHSFHSDGRWSVKGILESAQSNNLDFVSITDHNTFSHHEAIEKESREYDDLLIMRGEEVTTYGGHINVWGLSKNEWVDFRVSPNVEESARQIVKEAEKFGAIASINHPAMDCAGCRWTYGKWGQTAAVEIWNATWDEQDEIALIEWDKLLLNDVKITGIGSTDSHQRPEEPSEYPTNLTIGNPCVMVAAKGKTEGDILDGIKKGKVFVVDNPGLGMMLTANKTSTIGDTVEANYGEVIEFKYSLKGFENGAKFWLIANSQIAKELLIYDENYEGEYKIFAKQDGYVRLEVRGPGNKMLGFSNPIFFKVKYPEQTPGSNTE